MADNGRNGIYVHPQASGTVKAVFNRVEVYNNSRMGIFVDAQFFTGTINATVAESVAANNLSGINLIATESPGSLMVTRSVVANNVFDGLVASGAAATLRVGQSTATGNRVGVEAAGDGTVLSYGDNYLDGNVSGNVISATIPKK